MGNQLAPWFGKSLKICFTFVEKHSIIEFNEI